MTAEPTQHFVQSQRLRISYWDWGNESAPPLLLVHGGKDHARSWDRVAEAFRDEYHVVALDLRGHGDSEWTYGGTYGLPEFMLDIVRVLETIGTPARIISHSNGGSASLVVAGTYPELVSRLVVMEGTHSLNPTQHDRVNPAWVRDWADRVRSFETQTPRYYPDLEAAARRMKEANPRLPDDILPGLAQYAAKQTEHGYMWKYDLWVNGRTSMDLRRDELPAFWDAVECPVLLLLGSESHSLRRQHPTPGDHIRNLRTVQISGAGHWMHHDQRDVVLSEIRPFLAGGS